MLETILTIFLDFSIVFCPFDLENAVDAPTAINKQATIIRRTGNTRTKAPIPLPPTLLPTK